MDSALLYEEIQGGFHKGLRSAFIFASIVLMISAFVQLFLHRNLTQLILGLFTCGTVCALISVFLSTRLITQIRTDGIKVRFPPFRPAFTTYSWNSIRKVYLRRYDPIAEYGGWGIRYGPHGKAINLSGATGIQLVFKDGTRLLIGTNNPDKIAEALIYLGKLDCE